MKNEVGLPIEFKNHSFLRDIYDDMSPLQVILKAPQVGATVMHVLKALFIASRHGKQIIYTLPTQSDVYEMVGGSFNRIIAQNQTLLDLVKDTDTMEHKAVGRGLIRFRGTFTSKQAMMVASDLNIHDEVDASDPKIITQYETRLQSKADGWRWYFSHPNLAGHGVDIYWAQSDKKEWFITCSECNTEQYLQWPQNISVERRIYICSTCQKELDNHTRTIGRWKPTNSGAFSGYHISQLMCPWITADKILEARADPMKDEQYFYNYVLGLPYASSDDLISVDTVLNNVTDELNSQDDRVIIGVDTGLPIWYVLMNREGVFHWGKCKEPSADYNPYAELEGFLLRWPKSIIVSDQGGDLIGIRQLQAKYPGRVFLAYYRKDRKSQQVVQWGDKDEFGKVVIDRNRMIQLIVEMMRDTRFKLNGTKEEWRQFAEHFGNIYRVKTPPDESQYGVEYQWERRGPDHLVHCLVYAFTGFDRYSGLPQIVDAGPDWMSGLKQARIFTTLPPPV